jgi:hypothetical protein
MTIKTLDNVARDEEKLEWLLKVKGRQKDEAMHTLKTHAKISHRGD